MGSWIGGHIRVQSMVSMRSQHTQCDNLDSLRPWKIKVKLLRKYIKPTHVGRLWNSFSWMRRLVTRVHFVLMCLCRLCFLLFSYALSLQLQGTYIGATISEELPVFNSQLLCEGLWIIISGFHLVDQPRKDFMPINHPYCIVWSLTTYCHRDTFVKDIFRSFHEIGDINNRKFEISCAVDLIGEVINVGSYHSRALSSLGRRCFEVSFDLKNNGIIPCKLPKEYSYDFLEAVRESKEKVVVCAIRFARVIIYDSVFTVVTYLDCTDVLVNPSIPEAQKIRARVLQADVDGGN